MVGLLGWHVPAAALLCAAALGQWEACFPSHLCEGRLGGAWSPVPALPLPVFRCTSPCLSPNTRGPGSQGTNPPRRAPPPVPWRSPHPAALGLAAHTEQEVSRGPQLA